MANTTSSRSGGSLGNGHALVCFSLVLIAMALLARPVLDRVWPLRPEVLKIEVSGPVEVTSDFRGFRVDVLGSGSAPAGPR